MIFEVSVEMIIPDGLDEESQEWVDKFRYTVGDVGKKDNPLFNDCLGMVNGQPLVDVYDYGEVIYFEYTTHDDDPHLEGLAAITKLTGANMKVFYGNQGSGLHGIAEISGGSVVKDVYLRFWEHDYDNDKLRDPENIMKKYWAWSQDKAHSPGSMLSAMVFGQECLRLCPVCNAINHIDSMEYHRMEGIGGIDIEDWVCEGACDTLYTGQYSDFIKE